MNVETNFEVEHVLAKKTEVSRISHARAKTRLANTHFLYEPKRNVRACSTVRRHIFVQTPVAMAKESQSLAKKNNALLRGRRAAKRQQPKKTNRI